MLIKHGFLKDDVYYLLNLNYNLIIMVFMKNAIKKWFNPQK